MSARSFLRSGLLVALAACGKKAPAKAEADPAKVAELAAKMAREVPTPAAARDCKPADLAGGLHLTFPTLVRLGGGTPTDKPENADWINPAELESPAARAVLDKKDGKAARQAAAELLAAPMALAVKDPKRGTVGTRIIRYDRSGVPACVQVFTFQNDAAVSDDAIAKSDKALVDPAIAKRLRDDLATQYVKLVPR
jgi:hypothetical protein